MFFVNLKNAAFEMEGHNDECLFCKFDVAMATICRTFSHDVLCFAGEEQTSILSLCFTKELQLYILCLRFIRCNCHFWCWGLSAFKLKSQTSSADFCFQVFILVSSDTLVHSEVSQQLLDEEHRSLWLWWSWPVLLAPSAGWHFWLSVKCLDNYRMDYYRI